MLKRSIRYTIVLLFILSGLAHAQEVLQNNRPSLQWKQINTPDFRVIFPDGFDSEAQRLANTLQTIHDPEALGDKPPKKISIVLRNRNAIANGFVTLGPRRSELYTLPPQNNQFLGTNRWLDLLALHEYRHIAQFQHSKTGFNKLFYFLFGENTQAGMAFSAVPPWFWEGDATMIETVNSQSGRGRIPEFARTFKTNLLEKKAFNYHKQHLNSFKDFIPDHYRLGYHFVAHIRRRTGDPKIWDKVTQDAFGTPFIPFTFSNSLKKHTGHYLVDNYNQMMADVKQQWQRQIDDLQPSSFDQVTKRSSEAFADYSYPQELEDGSYVVYKQGIGDVGQLVRISQDGNEMGRVVTGVMNNTGMLSATQYKAVWNEFTFDPRWRAETYSVIKSYDFVSRKLQTLTKKSRYGGAAISPDGYQIVTALTTENHEHYLVLLDTYSGKELSRYRSPDNSLFTMANWSVDGSNIVALKTGDKGRSVVILDKELTQERELIGWTRENIGYPVLSGEYVFYNSPLTGIDNIFALNLSTGQRYQVTNSKYGAYNPEVAGQGKLLVYNEHTVNGLDIVRTPLNPEMWTPLEQMTDRNMHYIEPLVEQEGHGDILSKVTNTTYPVEKYSKIGHMINVHSWGPFATTDLNRAEFGIFSQDVLSTTTIKLGYTYDENEDTGFATAGFSYQGFYPILGFNVLYGTRSSDEGTLNNEEVRFEWDELGVETGVRIPWTLTKSKYFTELEVSNTVGYTKISSFDNSVLEGSRLAPINDSLAFFFRDIANDGDLIYNRASINFFRLMKRSKRDINSRLGQAASFELYNTPYSGDFEGRLFATRLSAYFPSPLQLAGAEVGKHHSLYFRFGYQSQLADLSSDLYYFRNRIAKPRGFSYPEHETFTTFSVNYTLPLWYPDIALGPFLNIQRFRANGFYDMGRGTGRNYFINYTQSPADVFFSVLDRTYRSVGGELLVDFNILRFAPLISMGVRYSYLLTSKQTDVEFIFLNIGL